MTSVIFTVPGGPVPFARAGGGTTTPRFTPRKQRDAMAVIRLFASRAMDGKTPMEGPLGLRLTFFYSVPPSWSKRKREEAIWKWSKPDGDNLQKLVKDACNRIVWVDDAQVADWSGRKIYGDREEIRVEVWQLGPDDKPEG